MSPDQLATGEVLRRFPLLYDIEDDEIRRETVEVTRDAPDYFWEVPSSTKYHPPVCRRHRGLWLHTLMVAQAVGDLWWAYESRGFVEDSQKDYALSAALLHDQLKYGQEHEEGDSADSDHDLAMAVAVDQNSLLPDKVDRCISHHMGASYDGPEPDAGTLEDLVHMADYAASRSNWRIRVDCEAPAELPDEHFTGGD
jgi:hypothetical protein